MPLIDYLMLVPLQQEWEAARSILAGGIDHLNPVPDKALTYSAWAQPVVTKQYAGEYLVAATPISLWTPGQAKTAVVATTALERWSPSRVILVGIAGSIEPDTARLGDVVVAAEVYGYEVSDALDGGDRLRPTFNQPGAADLNRAVTFKEDAKAYSAWRAACLADAATHGLADVVKEPPTIHLGVVGSGNRVVKSVQFGKRLKDEINKYIIAVEMEALAVHQAVYLDGGRTNALTVRGISDYADIDKEKLEKASKDGWRTWAASNAARFVRAMLDRGTLPPISTSYQLDLKKGPYKRFAERDVPRFSFRHVGSQNLAFTSLLRRTVATPQLDVYVTATTDAGTPASGFAGVCMVETPAHSAIRETPHTGAGLMFKLPPSEWGLNVELLVSFASPVREITVRCEDEFGRSDTKTINLTPITPGGTP
jgi:nucleoside phosphorylase